MDERRVWATQRRRHRRTSRWLACLRWARGWRTSVLFRLGRHLEFPLLRRVRCLAMVVAVAIAGALILPGASAHASLTNGACTLDLTFSFVNGSPTAPTGTSPGYTVSVNQANSSCTRDNLDPLPVDI